MKQFTFSERDHAFKVQLPDGNIEDRAEKVGDLAKIKGCLDSIARDKAIDYAESRIRDEIEDAAKAAFEGNDKKYPFDLVVDDALAGHLVRIVKGTGWVRRGPDIRGFLDAIDAVKDVEVKKGKVTEKGVEK